MNNPIAQCGQKRRTRQQHERAQSNEYFEASKLIKSYSCAIIPFVGIIMMLICCLVRAPSPKYRLIKRRTKRFRHGFE